MPLLSMLSTVKASGYSLTSQPTSQIEFVGGVANRSGANNAFSIPLTSLSGGLSSSPQAGDVVIVAIAVGIDDATTNPISISGYTTLASLISNPSEANDDDLYFNVAYKVLSSSDTSISASGLGSSTTYAVHVWRNVSNSTPIDVSPTTVTDSLRIATPPSITPVTPGAVILSAMGIGSDSLNATFSNSSMENLFTAGDANSSLQESSVGIASIAWSGSGSYTPTGWAISSTDNTSSGAAVTLALRPA